MSSLSAVVVAAGRSQRFNKSLSESTRVSKQLISWDGKPLFIHTLEALFELPLSQLALVILAEEEGAIRKYLNTFMPGKSIEIVFGGNRRQDSVRNGLNALATCDRVLVHDAARPFASVEFLNQLYKKSKSFDALIPVTSIVETLKEIDETGRVVKTHDRNRFVRVQTPQFFDFNILKAAHEKFKESAKEFTDDAAMMEEFGCEVQTMIGRSENIKITHPDDLIQRGIHV